ncbi:MAG: hypothetical protein JSW00_03365 [Thermoplasmata archaeon]|nr:MAG: hypothetical protein JSW00_03365 [Thermoplasmata archaeon]
MSAHRHENTKPKHRLTVNEKILLHLLENLKSKNKREAPFEITQKGIADGVNIRWNHVPRAMAQLKKMGYVSEEMTHIESKTRRQKVYYLTDEGIISAKNLREKILGWDVYLRREDGQVSKLKLSKVNSQLKTNFSPLLLYMSLPDDDIIDEKVILHDVKKEMAKKPSFVFYTSGEISWPERLIERETEIKTLSNWIEQNEYGTILIYGSVGIGKSALMAEMLKSYKDKKNIFWYQLSENDSQRDIISGISEFLTRLKITDLSASLKDDDTLDLFKVMRIMGNSLRGKDTILAFDNYFMVSEEVADLFSGLSDLAQKNVALKVIISARDTTPFYCRFYDKNEVKKRKIAELLIKGLSMEGIKQMLDAPNIDSDALKKIHLMTRGHPLTIELIKKGDVNSLKSIKGFSRQEASLLLYLKGVKAT